MVVEEDVSAEALNYQDPGGDVRVFYLETDVGFSLDWEGLAARVLHAVLLVKFMPCLVAKSRLMDDVLAPVSAMTGCSNPISPSSAPRAKSHNIVCVACFALLT